MAAVMTQHHGRIPEFGRGDRLRLARETAGIRSQQMANMLGIHRNTVTAYEGDRGKGPDLRTLIAWSTVTGVDLTWLRTGATPELPPSEDLPPKPTGRAKPARKANNRCSTPPSVAKPLLYAAA